MTSIPSIGGSWVAMVTPMTQAGDLDTEAVARLVRWHEVAGTRGLVLAGTTGESASLTDAEHESLIKTAVEARSGDLGLMVGVGAAATWRSIELARQAEKFPIDAVLAVTPYYLKTTQAGLIAHFEALSQAISCPMVLYNVPSRTGTDMLPETTAALSRFPGIVGIKEAVGTAERIVALTAQCAEGFVVLSGDDDTCLMAMERGAHGVISVTANIAPELMARLCELGLASQISGSRTLQDWLSPIHQALMSEPNPIPVKGWMGADGVITRAIRLPLVDVSADLLDELRRLGMRELPACAPALTDCTRQLLHSGK